MDIISSHYKDYKKLINDVKDKCEGKTIVFIKPMSDRCLESFPCRGHNGVIITIDTGETINFTCTTVKIGLIMYYFNVETLYGDHFMKYISEEMRKKLEKLRNSHFCCMC